jgi:hypothetical protein
LRFLLAALIFLTVLALYTSTAAPGTLFGDPSEYQFIPAILGIAHPPGYAFYTLLAKVWQLIVPLGSIAFRTNLLAAAVGAWTVTAVYLLVDDVQWAVTQAAPPARSTPGPSPWVPASAALALAAAPDLWQHAIHANAHIVSAALAVTHLWLLVRWWRTEEDVWLAAFAVTLGLAATHHPIVMMGVPAYGLFILATRPRFLLRGRTLVLLAVCVIVGLSPWVYYPLRSPDVPFGPRDMNMWDGFIRHVTARGLRVNLFRFGLADQPDRALVFWCLLRLQFLVPVLALMPLGLVILIRRAPRLALLMGGFLLGHLAFTLNTVQDVMAYLLMPFSALAVLAGVGAKALFDGVWQLMTSHGEVTGTIRSSRLCNLVLALFLLPWPTIRAVQNVSRGISLRDFIAAEEWVDAVHDRFDGKGEGAALLSAWEYLTPLWAHAYTEDLGLDEQDVELVYVSTALPWPDAVWAHIVEGPTYLPDYRPAVRDAGFRLVPDGAVYRIEVPPVRGVKPTRPLGLWVEDQVHILGYDLPERTVRAGDPLTLVVYQRAPKPIDGIWMPYGQLGPIEDRWTTDSRLLTTEWQPGEIVVERYELLVPFHLPAGDYALRLGYADLSGGRAELAFSTGEKRVELDTVKVLSNEAAPSMRTLERSLANLDNRVALMGARLRVGGQLRRAFWDEPIVVRAGNVAHLTLRWRAIASPRDSATVFIHLIDGAGRPISGWDYTPLGGSAPTYLWFPKWLPGQVLVDPYRLALPDDLPPGEYWLEVGMYGMTSHRRFPVVHLSGDLAGDRVILGSLRVE